MKEHNQEIANKLVKLAADILEGRVSVDSASFTTRCNTTECRIWGGPTTLVKIAPDSKELSISYRMMK